MKRGKPLRRTPMRRSRKAIKPVSDKRAAQRDERVDIVERLFERDGWECKLRGGFGFVILRGVKIDQPRCGGPLTPHHLRKASQGGTYTLDNLVTLCAVHNDWVENEPDVAHTLGLVIRRDD